MTQSYLTASVAVQLDASGNGVAAIGPSSAGETWYPQSVHVQVASNANEATCKIYVGNAPIAACFRDGTLSGSSGDSSDRVSSDRVQVGNQIYAVWAGGDPLAQATLNITGMKDV